MSCRDCCHVLSILKKRAQKGGEILLKHASGVQQNAMRLKKSRLPYGREMHDSFRLIVPPSFRSDGPSLRLYSSSEAVVFFSECWMGPVIYGYGGENVLAVSCPIVFQSIRKAVWAWESFREGNPFSEGKTAQNDEEHAEDLFRVLDATGINCFRVPVFPSHADPDAFFDPGEAAVHGSVPSDSVTVYGRKKLT